MAWISSIFLWYVAKWCIFNRATTTSSIFIKRSFGAERGETYNRQKENVISKWMKWESSASMLSWRAREEINLRIASNSLMSWAMYMEPSRDTLKLRGNYLLHRAVFAANLSAGHFFVLSVQRDNFAFNLQYFYDKTGNSLSTVRARLVTRLHCIVYWFKWTNKRSIEWDIYTTNSPLSDTASDIVKGFSNANIDLKFIVTDIWHPSLLRPPKCEEAKPLEQVCDSVLQ